MKLRVSALLMLLCAGLGFQPAHAAAVSISAGIQINAVADFYAPLEPYGTWVNVGNYGRCWHPTHVEANWRPYSLGHWEYTDVGWYWVSDEPFGWACFHYGSWVNDPQVGWVWLPGTEWSPAWVVWRESDSYIGWAPCGPNLTVASPSLFMFVSVGHFGDPIRPGSVIVNNTTIINNTRVVNNFRSETHRFDGGDRRMRVNAGPDISRVQRATGRHFNATPIGTAIEHQRRPENLNRSNERPERERAVTPEQRERERSATPEQSREHSVTTPEHRSVQEPSGAERQRTPALTPREQPPMPPTHREAPAARPQAPAHDRSAVKEPSGATRETTPAVKSHEAIAPSVGQEAPAPEKSSIKQPSGAARESTPSVTPHEAPGSSAPKQDIAPSSPQEEHRTVAPTHASPQSERAPVAPTHQAAPAQSESHAAPQSQHAQPVPQPAQQDRGNNHDHDRSHDQP